jgi:chaperonin GroES
MISTCIKPLHDRVLVRPILSEEKTSGGIIMPESAREKPQKGVVIAVGPGNGKSCMEVCVGDMVIYGKYSGTDVAQNDEKLLIIRESDIFGIEVSK